MKKKYCTCAQQAMAYHIQASITFQKRNILNMILHHINFPALDCRLNSELCQLEFFGHSAECFNQRCG